MSDWQLVKLGSVTTKVGSGATPRGGKDSYKSAGIPLIRSQNVHFDGFRDEGLAFLDDDQAEALKSVEVRADDVLLNITGASIGRVTTAPYRMSGARVNQHVCIIRPKPELRPSYLRWYLASPHVQHFIFDIQTGVTRQALTRDQILAFSVPLPPLEIQERIVSEIEKQFSRLEEAVTALKRIQANLKRYKAAVLKAAVEGKLTEQWRKEHPDVEPADQLLKRILVERRAKWEAEELAKMQAKGIKPKDDSWKKKYKEPAGPDTANLPGLPEGWVWASVEQLGDVFGGLTKNPKRESLPLQLPYLRVANVYANELRLDDVEQIGVDDKELDKLLIRCGDLLIVEGNGSPEQIGRLAIWDGSIDPCVHQNHLIKVRLSPNCLPKWTLYWLLSPKGRDFIREVSSSTSGLYTLSVGKVSNLPVPISSSAEQEQIINDIDSRLSVTEELEATIEANLKRTERLRQVVLKEAFWGP